MIGYITKKIKRLFGFEELCGEWHTESDGGFMTLMGSTMEIKNDGTGSYQSWANGGDETGYSFEGNFTWKRIGENKISITVSEKTEEIEYQIQIINGREKLTSKQNLQGSVQLESFWNFAQIMFRAK